MDGLEWMDDIIPTEYYVDDHMPIEGKRFIIPGSRYNKDWCNISGWNGNYKIVGMDYYEDELCYVVKLNMSDLSEVYFPVEDMGKK